MSKKKCPYKKISDQEKPSTLLGHCNELSVSNSNFFFSNQRMMTKIKKRFITFLFMSLSLSAGELPIINFEDAKNIDPDARTFIQRLMRYTCDGALTHAHTKNFIPEVIDLDTVRGKTSVEYQFKVQFDKAMNYAEMTITFKDGEYKAFISKDTRDGLCLLGKFSLKDIEQYESNL